MDSPIRSLAGVGPKREQLYTRLGLSTVGDLLRWYPRAYEDWSQVVPIAEAALRGDTVCVRGYVFTAPEAHTVRKGMTIFRFRVRDDSAVLLVTVFNNRFAAGKAVSGQEVLLFGKVEYTGHQYTMSSPLIEPAEGGAHIRPVYRQTEGLTSRMIEANVAQALQAAEEVLDRDFLPDPVRQAYRLCTARYAMQNIHFPTDEEALAVARRRLVFEELFLLQVGMLQLKNRSHTAAGAVMTCDHTEDFKRLLPFTMTGAQAKATADCGADMRSGRAMSRLVQGDVGSGKTAVAAAVAYHTVKNGYQAALMAPTEILAEQHFATLTKLLESTGLTVVLLTGALSAAKKRAVYAALESGEADIAVGTHALLSEGVRFAALGLVITDEQHRFGVEQRTRLTEKGEHPHLLVMSATPIPRTLALILYGDLDVSILNELPPGRQPIATYAVGTDKRERAYGYVRKHLEQGRQGYVVCPLVEESEAAGDLVPATAYVEALAKGPLAGYRLGLLHGRMKPAEKEAVMSAFSRGEIRVLVSTTVIEVGVDVPNAVIMVIENADRFGLAQLHQLRGRVGRGQYASTCILISDAQNEEATRRMKVMCATGDGFVIADEDLKLRGPGDFFGRRQHGLPDLKIADLQGGDMPLLRAAQSAAAEVVDADPDLSRHPLLAQQVARLFAQAGGAGIN